MGKSSNQPFCRSYHRWILFVLAVSIITNPSAVAFAPRSSTRKWQRRSQRQSSARDRHGASSARHGLPPSTEDCGDGDGTFPSAVDDASSPPSADADAIADLMREHDPILLFASRLLPRDASEDASALYAWCRRLDEIADDPSASDDPAGIRDRLDEWECRFEALKEGRPADGMDAALAECLERNAAKGLGTEPFEDMIAGMRSDAVDGVRRVEDREELEVYAYRVAGTVGLMLLPLLEADVERARMPAVALGKAIQLINILRDASPDAALGRVYLPQDELRRNGVEESDIFALRSSEGYCAVVASVARRASNLLLEAEKGRDTLPGPLGPLFVQLIIELYRDYLDELEQKGYDNLIPGGERVRISTVRKILSSIRAFQKVFVGL